MAGGTEESVKVLNAWRSPFGMRVLIALKEKGVAYEYQEEDVPHHKSELLLRSNPIHKKIPVLLHNGRPICESLIILQYIDEAWPSHNRFLPSDPLQRALARFWADYIDKKVVDAVVLILRNIEEDLIAKGTRDLTECMVTLDGALHDVFGGGPFFGGDQIGFLDIVLAPWAHWFEVLETIANFKLLDESKCPHLYAWVARVAEYPTVKEGLSIAPPAKLLESVLLSRKEASGRG